KARMVLMDLPREAVAGMRSASEPYALLLARTARERFGATWGLSETGAAGPTGNGYGDAPGHSCIAVSGPGEAVLTIETGEAARAGNMRAFAAAALEMLKRAVE
ncbi:MAG: putative competence-damaged inducible protein, partial [Phenylobacterium sp.]|nr:putative competence-damaged inducible protein [Phenylobacterium sp.]